MHKRNLSVENISLYFNINKGKTHWDGVTSNFIPLYCIVRLLKSAVIFRPGLIISKKK